jgi:multiple sugar transport system substrate-binding protein
MRFRSSTTGRRSLWPLLSAFILVAAACGSGPTGSPAASAGTTAQGSVAPLATTAPSGSAAAVAETIVFLTVHKQSELQPLLDGFKKVHPEITVEYEQVPFVDLQNILLQRLGTKSETPDVFYMDPTNIPAFTDRGLLEAMPDSFISEATSTLSVAASGGSMYRGKMMTMPVWGSAQTLYYNKKLLAAASVQAPPKTVDGRWTWEQLLPAAAKAQAAGAKWGFTFEQDDRYYQLQPLPESLGGGPGVKGDDLLTVDVTNDAWLKAAAWYGKIHADGISPRGVLAGDTEQLFMDGKLAFIISGSWNITPFNATKGLDYGYAPHPYFTGGKVATPAESWHFALNPNSTKKAAALELLRYAGFNEEGNFLSTEFRPYPPANLKAADKRLALLASSNPALVGIDDLIRKEISTTTVLRPRTPGYVQFEERIDQAWGDVRNGIDPKTAFSSAQTDLQQTFDHLH